MRWGTGGFIAASPGAGFGRRGASRRNWDPTLLRGESFIAPPLRHSQRFLIGWNCSWPSWRVRRRAFAIAFSSSRDRRCELWVASSITRMVTNI